jgi:hypothetical protein
MSMRYQNPKPVQTHELERHHCRWPVEGANAETVFCGANKLDDLPYCARHSSMAYQPSGATRSRAEVEATFRRMAKMRKARAA